MNSKTYFNIFASSSGGYSLKWGDKKSSHSALSTLEAIHKVVKEKGRLSTVFSDTEFSKLDKSDALYFLRDQANSIAKRYSQKIQTCSSFIKKIKNIDEEEKKISALVKSINLIVSKTITETLIKKEPLPVPPPTHSITMNPLVWENICSYLDIKSLQSVTQVSQDTKLESEYSMLSRIREQFGYKKEDFEGAKAYLKALYLEIDTLYERNALPVDMISYTDKGKLDYEKILKKLRGVPLKEVVQRLFSHTLPSREFINFLNFWAEKSKVDAKTPVNNDQLWKQIILTKREDCARLLLLKGAPPNECLGNNAETLLMHAAQSRNEPLVLTLLEQGADPGLANSFGETATLYAAYEGCFTQETIDLLLEKDENIDQQSINLQQTILHLAVTQKNIPLVLSLLKKNANVNLGCKRSLSFLYNGYPLSSRGFTALHLSVLMKDEQTSLKLLEALLSAKPALDMQTTEGFTPLHIAVYEGRMDLAKKLMEAGANKDLPSIRGETPLMTAIRKGHTALAVALIEQGANLQSTDIWGDSVFKYVCESGSTALLRAYWTARGRELPAHWISHSFLFRFWAQWHH